MSHEATNWAVKTKGLRPITKIVLWHLADCHNPSAGCFPTQSYLAAQCEISRSSINRQLDELEKIGLIRREATIDPETKRQRPTRYRLAFEEGFTPLHVASRVPEMDTGSAAEPCPTNDESSVPEMGEAVSQSYDTLTSKGTGNLTSKRKDARARLDPTEGFEVVAGKVRVHCDHPVFREVVRLRGRYPPTDRQGYWTFPPEVVARAQENLRREDAA